MLDLPTEPDMSKTIIEGIKFNCLNEVIGIICLLTYSNNIFRNSL